MMEEAWCLAEAPDGVKMLFSEALYPRDDAVSLLSSVKLVSFGCA